MKRDLGEINSGRAGLSSILMRNVHAQVLPALRDDLFVDGLFFHDRLAIDASGTLFSACQ